MARGLTDADQFFRRIESLALATLPTRELTAGAEAPKHHDGVMVALVPEESLALAVDGEGALPADDLHITLCYLGKVDDLSSFDKTDILSKTRSVVNEVGRPFSTNADGVVVMGKNDEGVPATALLVQSEDIVNLYDALSDALDFQSKFPSFIPHMTTGYGVPVEVAEEKVGYPINFNKVIVKFGEDVHEVPLDGGAMVAAPGEGGANVIDRVIDSLGRLWDEALHPRDREGKFIKKNGAVSGRMYVPSADQKSVDTVNANRASVVGFKTIDNEVWVLAEITNDDGSTTQGFAKALDVKAVAPVKARLDALYPASPQDGTPDGFLERRRQLDLILAHITSEYGHDNDIVGAAGFLDSLGLSAADVYYIKGGDDPEFLGGVRRIDRDLNDVEQQELDDIIADARSVKELRDRVHAIKDSHPEVVKMIGEHVQPTQRLLREAPDQAAVDALDAGADPFTVQTTNLLGAMHESDRFESLTPETVTGNSPIGWFVDPTDKTGNRVSLAGVNTPTTDRAYFVKESFIGAEFDNSDIVHEVLASLIYEQVGEDRALPIPKSVFGDNPEWNGGDMQNKGSKYVHQPGHVISQHAGYFVPPDWHTTDATTEEVTFQNDLRDITDDLARADQIAAFKEDMGNLYGNEVFKMILWDYAIANSDRNPSNALLASPPDGSEGRVLPIDHGFAFEDDPELIGADAGTTFEWFTRLKFTQAWLEYVLGGLDLGENVSDATLRQVVADFTDVYGKIDVDDIVERFRSIPGVTDGQIDRIEREMADVVDRINWIIDNSDTVLDRLTKRVPQ